MKSILISIFLFSSLACSAQELQIIKPDGNIFTTVKQNDFVTIRSLKGGEVSGRLTRFSLDTLVLHVPDGDRVFMLNEIVGMTKKTKLGTTMRRLRGYSGLAAVLILPTPNAGSERSFGNQILNRALIMIPTTIVIYAITSGRSPKRSDKGYSFVVKE